MKTHDFLYLLLICLSAVLVSCEKVTDHTSGSVTSNEQLESRNVEECDDCPIDDCCCAVELVAPTTSANLNLCGTTDAIGLCSFNSLPSPCTSTISGGGQHVTLTSLATNSLFCLNAGNSLCVTNNSGFQVRVRVSCQYNLAMPDWETVTIPYPGTICFASDGSCELTPCL